MKKRKLRHPSKPEQSISTLYYRLTQEEEGEIIKRAEKFSHSIYPDPSYYIIPHELRCDNDIASTHKGGDTSTHNSCNTSKWHIPYPGKNLNTPYCNIRCEAVYDDNMTAEGLTHEKKYKEQFVAKSRHPHEDIYMDDTHEYMHFNEQNTPLVINSVGIDTESCAAITSCSDVHKLDENNNCLLKRVDSKKHSVRPAVNKELVFISRCDRLHRHHYDFTPDSVVNNVSHGHGGYLFGGKGGAPSEAFSRCKCLVSSANMDGGDAVHLILDGNDKILSQNMNEYDGSVVLVNGEDSEKNSCDNRNSGITYGKILEKMSHPDIDDCGKVPVSVDTSPRCDTRDSGILPYFNHQVNGKFPVNEFSDVKPPASLNMGIYSTVENAKGQRMSCDLYSSSEDTALPVTNDIKFPNFADYYKVKRECKDRHKNSRAKCYTRVDKACKIKSGLSNRGMVLLTDWDNICLSYEKETDSCLKARKMTDQWSGSGQVVKHKKRIVTKASCFVTKGRGSQRRDCLVKLPEGTQLFKPDAKLVELVAHAIDASPDGLLQVQQIYTVLQNKYPFFRYIDKASINSWRSSIRHALYQKWFRKVKLQNGQVNSKGCFWTINRNFEPKEWSMPSGASDMSECFVSHPPSTTLMLIPDGLDSDHLDTYDDTVLGSGDHTPLPVPTYDLDPILSSSLYNDSESLDVDQWTRAFCIGQFCIGLRMADITLKIWPQCLMLAAECSSPNILDDLDPPTTSCDLELPLSQNEILNLNVWSDDMTECHATSFLRDQFM